MKINPEEYIVVVISSVKNAEKKILAQLGRNNEINEPWCYVDYSANPSLLKPELPDKEPSYKFFLMNPECLRRDATKHANCNERIESLLSNIKQKNKRNVIWLHNTDSIRDDEIAALGTSILCKSFSHADSVDNTDENGPEHFMFTVTEETFTSKFKTLLEYSFKAKSTPYLIALSILCQGYLAAHGRTEILSGWDQTWEKLNDGLKDSNNTYQLSNKHQTLQKSYWAPALGELSDELQIVTGDKDKIEELFTDIYDLNEEAEINEIPEFTEKVSDAYKQLKDILNQI